MADEAEIIELFDGGRPIRYSVQDAVPIPKGSLLELDDDRRVIVATNAAAPFVGIAAAEKVASDGSTTVAAYTDGLFDIKSDTGTDIRGTMMALSDATNIIETGVSGDLLIGNIVGYMIEAGTNNGTEAVRINK